MYLLHYKPHLFVLLSLIILESRGIFYECEDSKTLSLSSVMSLLDRVYPGCHQVDIQTEWVICEVNSEQDAIMLTNGSRMCIKSTYDTPCPDGSLNKTCYPVTSTQSVHHYDCICESVMRHDMMQGESYWGDWEQGTWDDYVHRRQLLIGTPPTCIMEEYVKRSFEYVITTAGFTDPDSLFSASSYNGLFHEPFRARYNAHFGFSCSWRSAFDDQLAPWLQISLPENPAYLVRGVVIKERCDWPFWGRPDVINITTSSDDVTWQDVLLEHDIADSYANSETSVWFDSASTNRYWKIHIVEYNGEPSMKCDLIGYKLVLPG